MSKFKKGDHVTYLVATLPAPTRYSGIVVKCGPKQALVLARFQVDESGNKVGTYLGYSYLMDPSRLTALSAGA